MATSGSTNYATSRDGLIAFALKKIGVVAKGATPSAVQISDAAVELNFMVKAWQTDGMQLWAKKRGYLFLAKDTTRYTLGPSGDHCTNSYVRTELTADSASSDTTLTVDSIVGVSSGDYVGVELDNGSLYWTTVNGAPSGSTITLTAGLNGAASEGNVVFTYTTKIQRPLRILQALRSDVNDVDIPLTIQALNDFYEMPNKTNDGRVTQISFIPTLTSAELYVWPQTDTVSDIITFWYHRPFEDFDATGDEPDFPQEWYLALGYGLADLLCDSYGVPAELRNKISSRAAYEKDRALTFDDEQASVFLQPTNEH